VKNFRRRIQQSIRVSSFVEILARSRAYVSGECVCSTPILATTEASSVGCRCWLGAGRTRVGESVCVVHRSWPPPRQARRGARGARGVRCGASVCVVHRSRPPKRQARVACRRGAGSAVWGECVCSTPIPATTEASSGGMPVLVGCWECGMLPTELASVEARICELHGPSALPAPHRACLGGSEDL
jgi:hypothetical protein